MQQIAIGLGLNFIGGTGDPTPGFFDYLRPDGVSYFRRPDGSSYYLRP